MNYFNYFTEIEETFVRRRGKHLLLSPLDWALIEDWKERDIPLRIILRGIENVFDTIEKNPRRSKNVKSLTYCRDEIEGLYEDWRESQIGKSSDSPEAEIPAESESDQQPQLFPESLVERHLEKLIAELTDLKAKASDEMRQTFETILEQLVEQKRTYNDAENLESKLNDLENFLDEALQKTSDQDLLADFKTEIERDLAGNRASMDEKVYKRTFDLMLKKKLREEAEIPRFSLFYL